MLRLYGWLDCRDYYRTKRLAQWQRGELCSSNYQRWIDSLSFGGVLCIRQPLYDLALPLIQRTHRKTPEVAEGPEQICALQKRRFRVAAVVADGNLDNTTAQLRKHLHRATLLGQALKF